MCNGNAFGLQTDGDYQSLVIDYNNSTTPYPSDKTIIELFEAQVELTPMDEAIRLGDQSLTYRELNNRANQMAAHLRSLGMGPDQLAVLYMEHSIEVVCAILGVLKSGAAYVPVDPASPQERLVFMLQDIMEGHAGTVPVLVTQSHMVNGLPSNVANVVTLDADFAAIGGYPVSNIRPSASPDSLAYIIYTSGSTGKPKGVMIEHRNLVNYIWWAKEKYCRGERLTWPLFSSLAFDLTVTSIFAPLITGGRIVVYGEATEAHSTLVFKVVEDNKADIVKLTPAHLAMIKDMNLRATRIRKLIVGGEDFKTDLAREITHNFARPIEIYNEYGPTEATVGCMIHRYDVDKDLSLSVPIGIPAANAGIYILDERLRPVTVGIIGEMYIAGDGLARGYLNRPELTEQRFLTTKDPRQNGEMTQASLATPATVRLYKTGDLARWTIDGRMEFLGRADQQVKVGGVRIELGEIEACLLKHIDIRECVVDVVNSEPSQPDEKGIKKLVAYYASEKSPTVAELRAHLARELPDYMLPAHFIRLERLPLTSNGKIDRKALPVPSSENIQPAQDFVKPRTETEKALAAIWTGLLKVENIGINDSFFDLGGHSLLAIKAVSRIRDVFGVDLPIQTLFENPTITVLSNILNEAKGLSGAIQRIERRKHGGPCPLSFQQEQLWMLDQMAPGSPVYNIVDVIRISGTYHAEAMLRAAKELVRRHEVLRTAFSHAEGKPIQLVKPMIDFSLSELDFRSLPEQQREHEWSSAVREEVRKPFDLSQAPLLRGTIAHLSHKEHQLLLVIHHIIADEWSMEVIHKEIEQLYEAFSRDRSSPLPELQIQYSDFACWHREWLQGDVLQQQIAYWKKELAGAPLVLELPTDKPRPAMQSFRGTTEFFELPKELLDRIKTLGRQEEVTLFMILEATFMALLYRYTGQEDILVGTPISGRTRTETERLIGYFLNVVVLRAKITERLNFRQLLQQVRERALRAYAHPDLPFEKLVAELAPERDSSHTPIFQVMFVVHDPEGISEVSNVSSSRKLETGTSKFDLTLLISETEHGLEGLIEYSTDLFEAETIRRMCGHYGTLLDAITRNPDQSISMLPMLANDERQQLLIDWNNTAVQYPEKDLCLHQLVEKQTGHNAEHIALVFEDQRLTYGELNRRANQTAHYLRRHGVGPDILVGLFVERSTKMLVGILGILKAGGAYVPMDPGYPKERLRYILEDSRAPIVLTQESLKNEVPNFAGQSICLDSDWAEIANESDTNPATQVKPEHLAYVLFTSGSTGRPKGVALEHRAAVNFVQWAKDVFSPQELSVVLFSTSVCFDLSVFEIFVTLSAGGRIILSPNALYLSTLPEKDELTLINTVPSAMAELLQMNAIPASLKTVNLAGEALTDRLVEDIYAATDVEKVYNLYGPTETTTYSTYRLVPRGCPVTVGKPIANTQTYILDASRNPVPIGVMGELYIAGDGLARCYYGRPELTEERFVNNPFSSDRGKRMYRTGDLCRWLPDGDIHYVGRIDHQVKLYGFRIELGEIEAVLRTQERVKEAVVMVREDQPGKKRLVAYVVAKGSVTLSDNELRSFLKTKLADYMIPSNFMLMEHFPLTPNGKLDRKALPVPENSHPASENVFAEPRTSNEKVLADIWQQVLRIERVGIQDNFFALGGNSIMSFQVINKANQAGLKLIPRQIFQYQTISELAKAAETSASPIAEQQANRALLLEKTKLLGLG